MLFTILTSFILLQNGFIATQVDKKTIIDEELLSSLMEQDAFRDTNMYISEYLNKDLSDHKKQDMMQKIKNLEYGHDLFIEFLDIIDLIIKIPSFVHPLIAKLKLALLTQVDYSIYPIYHKYSLKEKEFKTPFLKIIFDLIMKENIKDIKFSEFTDEQKHELERLEIFYIENEREKLFKEEEYKEKATSIFREARENPSLIEKLKEIFTPDEIEFILNHPEPAVLINAFTEKYYASKAETDRCLKRLIELFKSNKTIDKDALNEYLKSKTETDRLKKLEYLKYDIKSIDKDLNNKNNKLKNKRKLFQITLDYSNFIRLIKNYYTTKLNSTKWNSYYDSENYKPEILPPEITRRENIIKGTEEELQNQRIDKAMYNNKYYQNKFYLYLLFDIGLGKFSTNKPKDWLSGLSGIMIFFNWQKDGYCYNIDSFNESTKEFTLKLDNMYSSLEDIPTKEFAKKLAAAEAEKLAAAEAAKLAEEEATKLAEEEATKLAAAEAKK